MRSMKNLPSSGPFGRDGTPARQDHAWRAARSGAGLASCSRRIVGSMLALLIVAGSACDDKRQRAARAAADFARPASLDGLIRRAVAAIVDNNVAAYAKLLATASETRRACPDRYAKRDPAERRKKWQRLLATTRESLAKCSNLVDFKKARKVRVTGGERDKPVDHCKQEVVLLKDIHVVYELNKVQFEVIVAKPYVRQGSIYGVASRPHCRLVK